jgi:hypothetical protein
MPVCNSLEARVHPNLTGLYTRKVYRPYVVRN